MSMSRLRAASTGSEPHASVCWQMSVPMSSGDGHPPRSRHFARLYSYCSATTGAMVVSMATAHVLAEVAVCRYTPSVRSLGSTSGHMNTVKHSEHGTRNTSAAYQSVRRRPHARP